MSKLEVCGISFGVGAVGGGVIGGATGIALGIWACVEFVQPALAGVDGISESGASAITAAIALLGGLEATFGLGVCAGGAIGAILTPVATGVAYCASSVIENTKCPSFTFFGKKSKAQESIPAPEVTGSQLAV
ncbi:hypothetical protein [Legionella gresilensis]|uniref:hypothetical protein n=1 Tax=Legionella gresilensis TaxID=91823 RepID=UPI0010410201|nr:hypothetical protein [Legionella gresilensis]